jgi:predicted nuclease of predicted toxin-antitoxin system
VARLFAYENLPEPVVDELTRLGHDVLTVRAAGYADQSWPDPELLAFAAREGRAVVTLNRKDFLRLHRETPQHAGIVVCTFDIDFARQADRIDEALRDLGDPAGKVLRVNKP